jgi:hypothetical protein
MYNIASLSFLYRVELIRDQPFNIHGGWIFSALDQNIILTRSKKSDDFFSEYEKSVV